MARLAISVRNESEHEHCQLIVRVVEKVTPSMLRKMFPDSTEGEIQQVALALSVHHLDLSRLNRSYLKGQGL